MWDEVRDGAGSEGEGSCGPPFAPFCACPYGAGPRAASSLSTPPPAAVDKQGLNFHPEFPELSTLRQIGNLNFYMKSDFSVLTANSNV